RHTRFSRDWSSDVCSSDLSVGDKDLVKPTIEQLGGTLDMWRVNMKPGRPVALAHARNKPIVCLPGNPVSAFVVYALLVSPLVRKIGRASCRERECVAVVAG